VQKVIFLPFSFTLFDCCFPPHDRYDFVFFSFVFVFFVFVSCLAEIVFFLVSLFGDDDERGGIGPQVCWQHSQGDFLSSFDFLATEKCLPSLC
jgi:hypothetical protein